MLKPIQISILSIQLIAITFNFYAIYGKKAPDISGHILSIFLIVIIMILSIVSWYNIKVQEKASKS